MEPWQTVVNSAVVQAAQRMVDNTLLPLMSIQSLWEATQVYTACPHAIASHSKYTRVYQNL